VLSEPRARWTERDLISGFHQGQRPSAPRKPAGQMTAPRQIVTASQLHTCGAGPSTDDSTRLGHPAQLPQQGSGGGRGDRREAGRSTARRHHPRAARLRRGL